MTTTAGASAASAAGAPDRSDLHGLDAWWRAANYLAVGQIYLMDNPLLREPLTPEHIKPRLLGHWGTTPGLTFLWAHLNRVIVRDDLDALYVTGPGHGGPGVVATAYLEGTYSERYAHVTDDAEGMKALFRQFSFPGGIPSHAAPETPGSIHEGGELGYALSHAYGAAFDNPDLLVACVIGDGEAETGPLAGSWQANKFLHPVNDGTVLPILHLNGYKIANSTVMARIPEQELLQQLEGHGHRPYVVEGGFARNGRRGPHGRPRADGRDAGRDRRRDRPHPRPRQGAVRRRGAGRPAALARAGAAHPEGLDRPARGGREARRGHLARAPGAAVGDPRRTTRTAPSWSSGCGPTGPASCSTTRAGWSPSCARSTRAGAKRMSATPHANGGELLRDLRLPDFTDYAVDVPEPGSGPVGTTAVLGTWLRDVIRMNPDNFRMMAPDETASNRLQAVFEATDRQFVGDLVATDEGVAQVGRVTEVLSEHLCQGWLEGYLLTGRHGFFNCYEAFIHLVDSMFNQHAKWLDACRDIPWRRPIASLTYLLTSHVWRQDHNGFSHQDPGFVDHVLNKKPQIVRAYLPPDANTLLSTMDHCLRTRNYVNVVVAGKQPGPQWLTMDEAVAHCTRGLGIWDWASNCGPEEPDVVLGCAGDVPTIEALAAVSLLRRHLPELKVRLVNVVDIMRLQDEREHPHGLSDREFDGIFTTDKPVIFAYHGYPWLIHRLTYRRTNHPNIHVRGYKEEGTTTTPFDMVMLNDLDRFHLVIDVIDRVPGLAVTHAGLRQHMVDERLRCRRHTRQYGEDAPDVADWVWPG